MSLRIWNLRWRAVAALALAIGCGYWAAGACAPAPIQNTCEQLPDGNDGTNVFEIKAGVVSEQGRQLAFTRRIITNPQNGSVQIASEVTSDGELVMTWTLTSTASNSVVRSFIEYGPAVTDRADSTAAFVVEDGIMTGMVEGRAMIPMFVDEVDPNNITFEDGGPLPEMDVDPDLEAAMVNLFAVAGQTANSCQAQNGTSGKQVRRQLPAQDMGHGSHPGTSAECIGCKAGCSIAVGGCIGGVTAGCAALFICWPCVVACEVGGVGLCTGAYAGCVALCNGGPCCPVACGDVACCEQGESCLNPDFGFCCGEHKSTCLDDACCENTQTCIDFGPNAGTCCEPLDVCGNACCEPTDSCIPAESICCPEGTTPCDDKCCPEGEDCIDDGVCCEPENTCGTACCDDLDSCIGSLNLCCGFNQPACNDKCCDSGESCINGTTCCPTNLVCGSVCCPQGTTCDSETLICEACPNPTDTACTVGGCCPAGKFCTDFEGICCDQGEAYCNGACRPLNECIQ